MTFNNNYIRDDEFTAHVSILVSKYVLPLLGKENALKFINMDAWIEEVSVRMYENLSQVTGDYLKDCDEDDDHDVDIANDHILAFASNFWINFPLLDDFLGSFENFDPMSHIVHRDLPVDFSTELFYYKNEGLMPVNPSAYN